MSAERVRVVDNNPQVSTVVRRALESRGYHVREARDGDRAVEKLQEERYDLILLDVHTPQAGGVAPGRANRSRSDSVIIVFTVRDPEREKAEALNLGADDYLAKPFSTSELLARLRAAVRRASARGKAFPEHLSLQGLEVNFLCREVRVGGHESRLTPKEFELLSYFVTHPNRVIQGRELLRAVWGPDHENKIQYLRVFVNQLRRKIEPQRSKPTYLLTEPWVGYSFRIPNESHSGNPVMRMKRHRD